MLARLQLDRLSTRQVGPVDLAIDAGECVCLAGESGSGKTLLLRAIADLDPHQGEAWLDGTACSRVPAPQWRRSVALVAAESQWWADAVGAHFPGGVRGEWLDELALPREAIDWSVARCSTGERQRLALLRTLMLEPPVVLLDEPTGNLDAASAQRVEALLAAYREEHRAALLWVSHDEQQIARVAQRWFVLVDGRLEAGDRR